MTPQTQQPPYGRYDVVVLRDWARRMRKFRFCHAFGGHANDADTLQVRFHCDESDVIAFCARLGVSLQRFDTPPPQPEVGKSYSMDAMARFPSLIRNTRWIAQAGHCQIGGQKAFVWCESKTITITLGTDYVIHEDDVRRAEVIEPLLEGFEVQRIDPPIDSWHCICPKYHPAVFTSSEN